jgi:hypothetical protein
LQSINGIIIEQVGSVAVFASTTFYGILLVWLAGSVSYMSAGIIMAWGLACGLRWIQLQILINIAYKQKVIKDAREEIAHEGEADGEH